MTHFKKVVLSCVAVAALSACAAEPTAPVTKSKADATAQYNPVVCPGCLLGF